MVPGGVQETFERVQTFVQKKVPIYSIGDAGELTYDYQIIGKKTDDILKIIKKESL